MSQWVNRAELASCLGERLDSVQKACLRGGWQTRKVPGRGRGGQTEVLISSLPLEMQARLARTSGAAPYSNSSAGAGEAFAGATPEQQRRALARARVLELLAAHLARAGKGRRVKATDEFLNSFNRGEQDRQALEDLGRISSPRSLDNWKAGLTQRGLDGLLDRRGRPKGKGAVVSDDIKTFTWQCLLQAPTTSAANIWRLLPAQLPGRELPSRRALRDLVAGLKAERKEHLLMLHQPSLHKRLYQMSLGRADADLTEPNQRWEIDSTRGDIMGRRHSKVIEIVPRGGKRFTLVAVLDVFSRRLAVLCEEKGGGHNINLALIKAVRRLGLPLSIIMDLGKDYQSRAVQGFCANLGIETPAIPGYSPELKPHVERIFDTLQSDLFALLPGYTANRVENRREIVLASLSREQIQAEIDTWVERYERRVHGSTGQAPLERGNPQGWERRTVAEEQLRLLLCPEDERVIRQGFIRHNGGRFYNRDLAWLDGSAQVLVRSDPDDAGLLHVFDQQRRYICLATDLARLGLTPGQISEERHAHQAVRKLRRAEAQASAKAVNLTALNRQAARLEIAAAPAVAESPVELADLPALAAAVQAKQEQAAAAIPADLDPGETRPFFMDELERYKWIMDRLSRDMPIERADGEWMAGFEQTPLFRDLGGGDYREALLKGELLARAV